MTRDAAVAAAGLVDFAGALRCDNALPAATRDAAPVDDDRRVDDARLAAFEPVTLDAILAPLVGWNCRSSFGGERDR